MGNGQYEQFNSTLMNMLDTLTATKKANWKATRNEAIGFSTFYLVFVKQPRLPTDLPMGVESNERQVEVDSHADYTKQLRKGWNPHIRQQKAIRLSAKYHKRLNDIRVKRGTVDIGDRVLVRNIDLRGRNELANRWEEAKD